MKKIFLSLSLLLAVGVTAAFAYDNNGVTDRAQESFKKEFPDAQFTEWAISGDFEVASFVLGGHRTSAYFDNEGALAGCFRYLFYDQLPLAVMTAIDKRFPEAAIADVAEITNAGGTAYRVTLETGNKKYLVKADMSGNIESEKLKK